MLPSRIFLLICMTVNGAMFLFSGKVTAQHHEVTIAGSQGSICGNNCGCICIGYLLCTVMIAAGSAGYSDDKYACENDFHRWPGLVLIPKIQVTQPAI